MSSRQVKWLRQQLKHSEEEEHSEDEEALPAVEIQAPRFAFSQLKDAEQEDQDHRGAAGVQLPPPPPPRKQPKRKKGKQQSFNEEEELQFLQHMAAANKDRPVEKKEEETKLDLKRFNMAFELDAKLPDSAFADSIKVGKSMQRFISWRKRWGTVNLPYFALRKSGNAFDIEFTSTAVSQREVFRAFQNYNDMQSMLELFDEAPFCVPVLPIICQTLMFQREFEKATDIALRGTWILQQTFGSQFTPFESKLNYSEAYREFVDLLVFLSKFAFRRACYSSATFISQFALSLNDADYGDFALTSAVPALFAGDLAFIHQMMSSTIEWSGIPVCYLPDWSFAEALLERDEAKLSLAMAQYPFVFPQCMSAANFVFPDVLLTVGEALKKRLEPYIKEQEIDFLIDICICTALDLDQTEFHGKLVSYWYGCARSVIRSDIVEEEYLPAG